MTKRKVCIRDRIFVDGDECPLCKGSSFSTSWNGRMFILDPAKSLIAQKVEIKDKGEYAIKVR